MLNNVAFIRMKSNLKVYYSHVSSRHRAVLVMNSLEMLQFKLMLLNINFNNSCLITYLSYSDVLLWVFKPGVYIFM